MEAVCHQLSFIYPLLQTSVRIRRHKWHNPCPSGIYSLVRNPSLTLQSNKVGGCVLITVKCCKRSKMGLTRVAAVVNMLQKIEGTKRLDCKSKNFSFLKITFFPITFTMEKHASFKLVSIALDYRVCLTIVLMII